MFGKWANEIINNYDVYSNNAAKWANQFLWDTIIRQYLEIIER